MTYATHGNVAAYAQCMMTSPAAAHSIPDEDERLTAAVAHASIVANVAGLMGLALVVVLWATQREKSRFIRAHVMQALVYQGGTFLVTVILMLFWSGCLLLSLLPAALRPDLYRDGSLPDTFWFALSGLLLPIGYGIAAMLYAIYGAYQVYRGQLFIYPLAGRMVRHDLLAQASPVPAPAGVPALSPAHTSPAIEQPPAASETPAPASAEPGAAATGVEAPASSSLEVAPQAPDVFPPAGAGSGNHTAPDRMSPPATTSSADDQVERQLTDQPPER